MLNLWEKVVDDDKLHRNFTVISSGDFNQAERELLSQWSEGFVDRDGKFVKEFQQTFDSSFWELYLHRAFLELGFQHCYNHPAPDFLLKKGESEIVAEATTALNPDGFRPEHENDIEKPRPLEDIVDLSCIRLLNSISQKGQKYLDSYRNLSHVQDQPFLICVAPMEQPQTYSQNQEAIRRVLYGLGKPVAIKDRSGALIQVGQEFVPTIKKASGTSLDLGYFLNPENSHVSGVLFTTCATFSKVRALSERKDDPAIFMSVRYNVGGSEPIVSEAKKEDYSESVVDGLNLYLNPFADHPLDLNLFNDEDIVVSEFDPRTSELLVHVHSSALIQRMCLTFRKFEDKEELKVIASEKSDFKPMAPLDKIDFADGHLHRLEAETDLADEHYLSHYMGGSILIIRDRIDREWAGIAIPGEFRTIHDFVASRPLVNPKDDVQLGFFDSKEEAFKAVKKRVDHILD